MSVALLCVAAVALDALLGEPRRWHPLVAFGNFAARIEQRFNSGGRGWRSHGVTAWFIAVVPLTLLATALSWAPYIGWVLEILALYCALGMRSLGEHVIPVAQARSFVERLESGSAGPVSYVEFPGAGHGFDLVVSGEPALFYLRVANDESLMLHQEWIAECVSRGLFLASHHNHFMNAAVTQDDIKLAIDIAEDAFGVVAANHPEIPGLVK